MGESDSSDIDPDNCNSTGRCHSALPLGHSSVKSLSTKFSNSSSPSNSLNGERSQNGGHSRPEAAVLEEQKRLIESLRQQVTKAVHFKVN